jgi:hypothetical protein
LQKVTYKYGLTSGWTQEYSYKDDGSLFSVEKNITEGSSGQANQAAGIEYDENGNIANVSVVYKYTAGGQDKGSVEYTYKRILTTEDAGSIDQAIYAYDILKPSCQTLFWNPAKVQNDLNTSVIYGGLPEVFQHGEGTGEDLLQEELNKAS